MGFFMGFFGDYLSFGQQKRTGVGSGKLKGLESWKVLWLLRHLKQGTKRKISFWIKNLPRFYYTMNLHYPV